jgi:phage terminase large subunit-like protein
MTTDEKLRARARKAQAKPLGDHRIVSAEFTAYTARIACSCGMSVTHTGADRRRIVDRFHVHQQAGAGNRFTDVRRIETLAGPAGLLGLPSRRAPRTTASRRRRT